MPVQQTQYLSRSYAQEKEPDRTGIRSEVICLSFIARTRGVPLQNKSVFVLKQPIEINRGNPFPAVLTNTHPDVTIWQNTTKDEQKEGVLCCKLPS